MVVYDSNGYYLWLAIKRRGHNKEFNWWSRSCRSSFSMWGEYYLQLNFVRSFIIRDPKVTVLQVASRPPNLWDEVLYWIQCSSRKCNVKVRSICTYIPIYVPQVVVVKQMIRDVVVVVACDHCNTASAKGPRTDDEMQSLIYIRGAIDCSSLRSQNERSVGMGERTDLN